MVHSVFQLYCASYLVLLMIDKIGQTVFTHNYADVKSSGRLFEPDSA